MSATTEQKLRWTIEAHDNVQRLMPKDTAPRFDAGWYKEQYTSLMRQLRRMIDDYDASEDADSEIPGLLNQESE